MTLMEQLKTEVTRRPEEMPALALAYIGDAVWEVYVRQHLLAMGELKPHRLQTGAVNYVKAKAQSDILHHIMTELNEEEQAVVRRGRNAKSGTVPKNADVIDYRHSTGFETVIGYLYLKSEFDRLNELVNLSISFIDETLRKG